MQIIVLITQKAEVGKKPRGTFHLSWEIIGADTYFIR